jgi:hypothetical protein
METLVVGIVKRGSRNLQFSLKRASSFPKELRREERISLTFQVDVCRE